MPSAIRRLNARHLLRLLPIAAICALAILTMPATVLADPSPSTEASSEATKSYIVVLEDSVNHPGRVAQRHAVNRGADLDNVYKSAIEGYAAEMTPADRRAIEADPNVAYVVPNAVMHTFAQETPRGLQRISAAGNTTLDIDEVDDVQVNADVAVIDTGIDYDHPDLRVVERTNCLNPGKNVCVNDQGDDANGHGTHVAGTIGALDNSFGVVGVAPGVRLWAVKAGNASGAFSLDNVIAGVDWITARAGQIEVVNMSLGCEPGKCEESAQPLHEAIEDSVDAGVVYVVAAGNDSVPVFNGTVRIADGIGHTRPFDVPNGVPASFPEVITVTALADFDGSPGSNGTATCEYGLQTRVKYDPPITGTPYYYDDIDDSLAGFSNWGNRVDVAAPGTCIDSTYKHGRYAQLSGTSMAAPHIAGAAAILASVDNPSTAGDVEDIRDVIRGEGSQEWDATHPELTVDNSDWEWIGDSEHEPLLDLSNESVFKVAHPGSVGSIGVTSDNTYDLDIFARGGNNEIWRKAYRSTHWGNWSSFTLPEGAPIVGAPAVISRRADSTDLFVKAENGGIGFRNKWQETWSPWYPIYPPDGKAILSSPAATNRPDIYDGLTMLVRGHDGSIYLKNYWESIPGGWSPWENLGAPAAGTASSPAITMFDKSVLFAMVRGADGVIYGKAWNTSEQKWGAWINLGGGFVSAPAMATSRSGEESYLFGVKTDGKLWMRKVVKGTFGWSEWESLGGNWVADPAATSRESHGVSVFAVGLDNKIQERRYTYGGWTNWMRIDDDCPPEACSWDPGGPGTGHAHSVEANDLVTVDSEGTANVFPGYGEGFDTEDPVTSLEGELDSALLDGKGHYVVDVADVDDDDNSDLVAVKDDGTVLVHLGEEDRTFAEALDTGISLPPVMNGAGNNEPIAVADVTGDGFDDLVVFVGPGSGSIKLYKGQENGKFASSAVTSLSGSVNSALTDLDGSYFLDVVDVTGDGLADLVAMGTNGTTSVYPGQEAGTFGSAVSAATINPALDDGSGHEPVGLGDVTDDGMADLVTLEKSTLKIWLGQSSGKFATAATAYGSSVDSAMLDGDGLELLGLLDNDADGRADLVASNASGDLLTYKAQSEAQFAEPVLTEGDIASVKRDEISGHEFALEKPFQRRTRCILEGCPWPPEPLNDSDVDGDGRADLVTLHTNGSAYVYGGTSSGFDLESPEGSFAGSLDSALFDGSGHYMDDVADVNGDHRGDLVTQTEEGAVHVHRGKTDRTFAAGVEAYALDEDLEDIEPVATADVDGDLHADLVEVGMEDEESLALVVPGRADGTFSEEDAETSLQGVTDSALLDGSGEYFLDVIDVDGDKRADLVSMATSGTIRVYKGEADRSFAAAITAASSVNPIMDDGSGHEPIGLADVTGDTRADLVTLDATGAVKLYAGKADGTFASPTSAYSGPIDSSLMDGIGRELPGLFDYNRDGLADLVTIGESGAVNVYRALGNATFSWASLGSESLISSRFANSPAEELVSEKPLLRRAGCAPSGCEWPPTPPPADPPEPEPTDWSEVQVGEAEGDLDDVWCESWECVAVGDAVTDSGIQRAQVSRWDGNNWIPSWPIEGEADPTELEGVTCSSSECIAVGSYEDGGSSHALMLKGDGYSWEESSIPEPAGAKSSKLADVSCAGSSMCMAVGTYVDSTDVTRTLVLRWNGSAWSVSSTPTSYPATSSKLADVSCRSEGSCLAVGSYVEQSSGKKVALALRWNSSTWSVAATPGAEGTTPREFSGVWCEESSPCLAVGSYTAASGDKRNWSASIGDGSSWSAIPTPNPSGEGGLTAVSCSGDSMSQCAASGSSQFNSKMRPTVLEWNGSFWEDHVLELPPGAPAAELAGISCWEGECAAVGTTSFGTSRSRNAGYLFAGGSSGFVDSGYGGSLRGISCILATECVAVGDAAIPVGEQDFALGWHLDGDEWQASRSAEVSGPVLNDVSCTAADQCTAVGTQTTGWPPLPLAERWNGEAWIQQSTPNPGNEGLSLTGVSCYASNGCISVGWYWQSSRSLPLAQKWNGSTWSTMSVPAPSGTPTSTMLRDISCTAANDCFAVGSSSASSNYALIERWNGTAWSLQSAPLPSGATGGSLRAISCTSASACTAAGTYTASGGQNHPLVLRWNGTAWSVQLSSSPSGATAADITDVACYSATGCVAVGSYSAATASLPLAMRWDGSSWALESTPQIAGSSLPSLRSVDCDSTGACQAVGSAQFENGRNELLVLAQAE
jgi:subtilisin family serine protease